MKKSKIVTIALLALSIASCHEHKKSTKRNINDWENGNSAYVSTDGDNYNSGGIGSNFSVLMYLMKSNNGNYYYAPYATYRSGYNNFRSSNGTYSLSRPSMRSSFAGRSSVSRLSLIHI